MALNASIPVQQAISASPADRRAPNAYSFIGGNKSIWYVSRKDIEKIKPKYVAVLTMENPVGKFAADESRGTTFQGTWHTVRQIGVLYCRR